MGNVSTEAPSSVMQLRMFLIDDRYLKAFGRPWSSDWAQPPMSLQVLSRPFRLKDGENQSHSFIADGVLPQPDP